MTASGLPVFVELTVALQLVADDAKTTSERTNAAGLSMCFILSLVLHRFTNKAIKVLSQ
jgi:hypothetical protein